MVASYPAPGSVSIGKYEAIYMMGFQWDKPCTNNWCRVSSMHRREGDTCGGPWSQLNSKAVVRDGHPVPPLDDHSPWVF